MADSVCSKHDSIQDSSQMTSRYPASMCPNVGACSNHDPLPILCNMQCSKPATWVACPFSFMYALDICEVEVSFWM